MADNREPLTPEERRRLEVRGTDRAGWGGLWAWWWIWLLIIILFFGWFGGWGYGGHGGWWGWGGNRPVVVMQPGAGYQNSTLADLTAPNKASFIGKQVSLNEVQVQGSAGSKAWWIGPNSSQELLVVAPANGNQAGVNNGELVNITGTVMKAPMKDEAQQQWGISAEDATRLESDGVYLQANSVNQPQGR